MSKQEYDGLDTEDEFDDEKAAALLADDLRTKVLKRFKPLVLKAHEVEVDVSHDPTDSAGNCRDDIEYVNESLQEMVGKSGTFRVVEVATILQAAEWAGMISDEDDAYYAIESHFDRGNNEQEYVVIPPGLRKADSYEERTGDFCANIRLILCTKPIPAKKRKKTAT